MIKIMKYSEVNSSEVFARSEELIDVSAVVKEIIEAVKINKDEALKQYCLKFDGASLDSLEVS